MKPLFVLLAFTALTSQAALAQDAGLDHAQPNQNAAGPPFSISISAAQNVVQVGKAIFINIVMTNTSNHPINAPSVWMAGFDMVYGFEVHDSAGSQIAWHAPGTVAGVDNMNSGTLDPGKTASEQVRIDRFYKLTKPGTYEIQVKHYVSMENPQGDSAPKYDAAKGEVWSNKITITVVPADATVSQ
jgi:hypothetical protein